MTSLKSSIHQFNDYCHQTQCDLKNLHQGPNSWVDLFLFLFVGLGSTATAKVRANCVARPQCSLLFRQAESKELPSQLFSQIENC